MRKLLLLLAFSGLAFGASAQSNDTVTVRSHDAAHMNWYGNFDSWGVFPAAANTYRKIIMKYTLGCPSGGCSDWDYTTRVFIRNRTGQLDTAGAEIVENIEVGRVITPYGGNFNSTWKWEYRMDLTDYAALLHDSVEVRVFYDGWSDGFTATLDFEMIEGTPPRKAFGIANLWNGSFPYGDPSNSIENYLSPKTVAVPANAAGVGLRILQTGHGFGGNQNCAEFCPKYNHVKVNNTFAFNNLIWRDNCGENPLFPQAGTWLYNRANWCPGDKSDPYFHELTPLVTPGQPLDLDLDMDPFTNINNNNTAYVVGSHVIFYEPIAHAVDAEIADVLAPNNYKAYSRFNPICKRPQVVLRNTGSAALTTATISYGVPGGIPQTYQWSGNLNFLDTAVVTLPALDLMVPGLDRKFYATVSNPNGQADGYAANNTYTSAYAVPPTHTNQFIVALNTNARGFENSLQIVNEQGQVMLFKNNLASATAYRDTLNLPDGCYQMRVFDSAGDGLSFFANTAQGNGSLRFTRLNNTIMKSFPADFGSSITYNFSVAAPLGTEEDFSQMLSIYPNPGTGVFHLTFTEPAKSAVSVTLFDVTGRAALNTTLAGNGSQFTIDAQELPSGLYHLSAQFNGKVINQRLVIQ